MFDLVIYHTTLLSERWLRPAFARVVTRIAPTADFDCQKIILPQDEFAESTLLVEFIRNFGVTHACSVAPESEWGAIYAGVDRERVQLRRVLTGYLPVAESQAEPRTQDYRSRCVDIGYRVRPARYWLGRVGLLKSAIGEAVMLSPAARTMKLDVAVGDRATLYGDAWLAFLRRARFTIGAEGGSSIHDRDGSLRQRADDYLSHHPRATFEEVEQACFPGRDGEIALSALSPRHLEACATHTAQILVEGQYNGVLKPNIHYLPVAADLSNLDEVLRQRLSAHDWLDLTRAAHRDVVASGRYTYRSFVEQVLSASVAGSTPGGASGAADRALAANQVLERLAQRWGEVRSASRQLVARALGVDRTASLKAELRQRGMNLLRWWS